MLFIANTCPYTPTPARLSLECLYRDAARLPFDSDAPCHMCPTCLLLHPPLHK